MLMITESVNTGTFFREKVKQSQFKIASLEERDSSEDSNYWASYAKLVDEKKERLWDALLEGLEKYRSVNRIMGTARYYSHVHYHTVMYREQTFICDNRITHYM